MNEYFIEVLVWVVFFIAVLGMALTQLLFQELKKKHPEEYIKIGSPHVITNNTPSNNWKFTKWIFLNNGNKFSRKVYFIVLSIRVVIFIVWFYFLGGCIYLILKAI